MPIWLPGSGDTLLFSRSEWGARPARSVTPLEPSYGSTVHWTGPHLGAFPHTSCATKVRAIQNYHMDNNGWVDLAYSCIICPHGSAYEGRWVGRRTAANGTNAGNSSAYAVCYLGGDGDGFSSAGSRAIHDVVAYLRSKGGAGLGVNCHKDWKSTSCPGTIICDRVHTGLYRREPPHHNNTSRNVMLIIQRGKTNDPDDGGEGGLWATDGLSRKAYGSMAELNYDKTLGLLNSGGHTVYPKNLFLRLADTRHPGQIKTDTVEILAGLSDGGRVDVAALAKALVEDEGLDSQVAYGVVKELAERLGG